MRFTKLFLMVSLVAGLGGKLQAYDAPASGTEDSSSAGTATATPPATPTEDAVQEMSEVVVTGSYIKAQPGFAQSSPIDVVSHDAITAADAVDIAHLFADLPEVAGSSFGSGTAQGAATGGANINLRGLGAAATLVLIDGKRSTQFPSSASNIVDVNNLLPQIMIGRVDILKDGASALYGTDAVGGVVNFVTRDQFSGIELGAEDNRLTEVGGKGGYRFDGILGGGQDRAHIVVGFEFDHTDTVPLQSLQGSRNFPLGTTETFNYNVPTATGIKVTPDPDCGKVAESYLSKGNCYDYFWNAVDAVPNEDRFLTYSVGTYDLSDTVKLRADAGYAHDVIENSSAAAAPLAQAVTVPANNPGNPFGVAVTTTTRIIGSQGGLPTDDSLPAGEFELNRPGMAVNDVYRTGVTLSGDFSSWNWNVGGNYSNYRNSTDGADQDVNVPNLIRALNGFGGPNCNLITGVAGQGNCSYFNPFLGSTFATPGSAAANTAQLVNWIMPPEYNVYTSSLWELDAILSGSLWKLPGGPLGVAVGGQWRRSTQTATYDPTLASGESETFVPSFDFSASRNTRAGFMELNAPVLDSPGGKLDLDGTVRYETSGGDLKSTDPKFGVTYTAPNDFAVVRGSWGKSFLAPSLFQEYARTSTTGLINDPLTGAVIRPTIVTSGNPGLLPQTATSYSAGFDIRPVSGLTLGATLWHVHFSNLIATQNAQQLVDQDPNSTQITRDPVTGAPSIIAISYFNASSVTTAGVDIEAAYKADLQGWGKLQFDSAVTHVTEYELQAVPGGPIIDGRDRYNGTTFAFPSISWKGSGRVTWQLLDNSLTSAVHYRGPFHNDETLGFFNPNVPSFTTVDLAYTYTLRQKVVGFLGVNNSISFTAGATNLFDRVAPGGTFDYFFTNIDDYRGRIVYLNALARF